MLKCQISISNLKPKKSNLLFKKLTKYHFFIANEIKVSESTCSAICGVGKKTITFVTSETVDCGNSHCKPDIHEVEVDCNTNITCAPEQKNPEWSEWSSCSDNCIKNVNEKPTQTRKGSCNGCRLAILQVYKTA